MHYFDYAATSLPKPPKVTQAVADAMAAFGNAARAAHGPAMDALRCIVQARSDIAAFFGCKRPEQVVFTTGATEALNIAIASVEGHLITTEAEHNSVLRPAHRHGNTTIIPVDAKGCYTLADIASSVRPDTRAVVVAHVSNMTGNAAPLEELGRFCGANGLLLIVDAAQSAGLLPLDMEACGIDAVCFSAHKYLWGPQGIGGLCLAGHFLPKPFVVGGTSSRSFSLDQPDKLPDRLEAGTLNSHSIAGMAAGLHYVQGQTAEAMQLEATRMAKLFLSLVYDVPGLVLYGDYEAPVRGPIVTFNIGSMPSGEVADRLWHRDRIAVRAGALCAPLLHLQFGTEAQGAVRFSFSHQNSAQQVEQAAEAVRHIAAHK